MTRRTVALSLAVAMVWVTPVHGSPEASPAPAAATRALEVRDWVAATTDGGRTTAAAADEDHADEDLEGHDDGHGHDAPTGDWFVSDVVDAGPAVLVGADWGGDEDTAVQVRARDAAGWTEWVDLHVHHEHVPDDGSAEAATAASTASDPVYVGRVDDLQFRARGGRPDLEVNLVDIDGDLSWSPDDVPAGAAAAATARPTIRTRAAWGADESIRSSKVDYADDVRFSVVHHEGGTPRWTKAAIADGCRSADDAIRAIYEYHVKYRGYWDIAYNFVVDPCGGIWEGRAGGMDRAVMGAHAGGWNSGSVGVLALGTFQDVNSSSGTKSADPVTPELVSGIEQLLAWKLDLHHTDPRGTSREISGGGSSRYASGTPVNVPVLSAHQITNNTSCPGAVLMDRLFTGREGSAKPRTAYTNNVLTEGLPKAFDAQPARWVASERGDRPSWDVRFSEPLDWSLRITDDEGELVRATGGHLEDRAQRTWDLRTSAGDHVDAGTYTATLTGRGASGSITPVVTELVVSPTVKRRMGRDRVETSLALSTWGFEKADTAIVASAAAYPDALVSGPLAGSLDAPVLLTDRDQLPEAVEEEIERLGATRVIVIGGVAAVSRDVEAELDSDLPDGVTVERIGGRDRFETAALVADQVRAAAPSQEVLLSLGAHAEERRAFPDALSAGAFGADQQLPVLLTAGTVLPAVTRDALEELGPSTVTLFGGTAAISERVEDAVTRTVDAEVSRIAGEDRYATSRLAAEELLERRGIPTRSEASADADPVDLIFASGDNWPDALGAGAAAAATGAVFLLTHPHDLDGGVGTRGFLDAWDGRIGAANVAGGPAAVTSHVISEIAAYVSTGEFESEPIEWSDDPHADADLVGAIGELRPDGS